MKSVKNNQSGFTLIELLVVIVIVAVLAAVGVPLMTGNVEKAKLTEAVAGLSSIRTLARASLAEKGKYPDPTSLKILGVKAGDLRGRFFDDGNYQVVAAEGTPGDTTTVNGFCAGVQGKTALTTGTDPSGNTYTNTAVAAAQAVDSTGTGLKRSMNQDGSIFSSLDCSGTALNA